MITRRELLIATAVAGGIAEFIPISVWAKQALTPIARVELFPGVSLADTRARALTLLNTPFQILYDEWHVTEVVLTAVEDIANGTGLDQFVLRFHGVYGEPVEDGTYTVQHAEFGTFPLYLEMVRGAVGDEYTATVCIYDKQRIKAANRR
jgi:hypothetical protein